MQDLWNFSWKMTRLLAGHFLFTPTDHGVPQFLLLGWVRSRPRDQQWHQPGEHAFLATSVQNKQGCRRSCAAQTHPSSKPACVGGKRDRGRWPGHSAFAAKLSSRKSPPKISAQFPRRTQSCHAPTSGAGLAVHQGICSHSRNGAPSALRTARTEMPCQIHSSYWMTLTVAPWFSK